jgi:hypothetical protein
MKINHLVISFWCIVVASSLSLFLGSVKIALLLLLLFATLLLVVAELIRNKFNKEVKPYLDLFTLFKECPQS